MLEDKWLISLARRGECDAWERIYLKYRHDCLALAVALLGRQDQAEDMVHEVFAVLVRLGSDWHCRTNLKGYLLTAVANRVRSLKRSQARKPVPNVTEGETCSPVTLVAGKEQVQRIDRALRQLPLEQQDVIVLHCQGGMTFKAIAKNSELSIHTVRSRYRYGLERLRSLLDGEVTP
ncbi:MAG: sigma-70 family RNA polymerase sigma factor [Phycisphaeraceae bacterium]|nr:sigma-70 family RNA polymerase sigma factor [Phycisphaeraceae bacterium]